MVIEAEDEDGKMMMMMMVMIIIMRNLCRVKGNRTHPAFHNSRRKIIARLTGAEAATQRGKQAALVFGCCARALQPSQARPGRANER